MMVGLSVTVVVGVTYRWAGQALVWYDEVAAIQLAWLTYYGAAYASLKGAHIGVPSIIKAFPKIIRQYLFVLSKIVIYSFSGLLVSIFFLKKISEYKKDQIKNKHELEVYRHDFTDKYIDDGYDAY